MLSLQLNERLRSTVKALPARSPLDARKTQARSAETRRRFRRFAEARQPVLPPRIFRKAPARVVRSDLFCSSPSCGIHRLEFLEHRQDVFLPPRSCSHRARYTRSIAGLVCLAAHAGDLRTSRPRTRPGATRSHSRERQTTRTTFRNDQPVAAGVSRLDRFVRRYPDRAFA